VELLNELRAGQAFTAVVLALASIGAGLLASALGYGLGIHA
jgi:CrcB protein